MPYCRMCGVPRILTNEHRWVPNGTISLANDATHRMVLIDNVALNHILDSIAGRIGMSVDSIVAEAKRKSARHFMDAVLKGLKGVVARNLISTRVYEQLAKQVSMLGLGHATVTSYRRHSHLEGIIRDAYSAPAIAGDIGGAFESVEGFDADIRWEDAGGDVKVIIEGSDSQRQEFAERFGYLSPALVPGSSIYELCALCRAPIGLGSQYSFDMEAGLIREKKTGHRAVMTGVMTLNNLFGELEAELGEEIPRMIMTIERERVRDVIREKGKELETGEPGYLRFMKTLEIRGMGRGSLISISDGGVSARVDNPYYEPLVAGFLAGFYDATGGGDASVEWTDATGGFTEVTIAPSR